MINSFILCLISSRCFSTRKANMCKYIRFPLRERLFRLSLSHLNFAPSSSDSKSERRQKYETKKKSNSNDGNFLLRCLSFTCLAFSGPSSSFSWLFFLSSSIKQSRVPKPFSGDTNERKLFLRCCCWLQFWNAIPSSNIVVVEGCFNRVSTCARLIRGDKGISSSSLFSITFYSNLFWRNLLRDFFLTEVRSYWRNHFLLTHFPLGRRTKSRENKFSLNVYTRSTFSATTQ